MIHHLLRDGGMLLLDGGLATELEAHGHNINNALWSASLLLSQPRAIVDAHRAYLDAGAQCITSASYQASRSGLVAAGHSAADADRLIQSSVDLARRAVDEYLLENMAGKMDNDPDVPRRPLVAASIGPYAAVQHDGSEYTGIYRADRDDLIALHRDRLTLLDRSGADVLAVETIPNAMELEVLSELLLEVRTPAWISFCCRDDAHLSDGTSVAAAASLFAKHPAVFAIGINCTSPSYAVTLIRSIRAAAPAKAIVVYPNSGEKFDAQSKTWHGTVTPLQCAQAALEWRKAGASLIGGCCRMGPPHIAAMAEALGLKRERTTISDNNRQ